MTAYLVSFIAAALIGSRASACSGRRKIAFTLLACLPLALLAGLRSWTLGIDTSGYPLVGYYAAQTGGPFHVSEVTGCEIGFSFIIWLLSILTHDFNAVLFLVQTIMLLLLAAQLIRLDSRHIGLALFVHACIFLPWSFNLMRQALACSFFLFALQFVQERRLIAFILTLIVATSIHRTTIAGFVIWPIYRMAVSGDRRTKSILTASLFILLAVVAVLIVSGEGLLDLLSVIKASYSYDVLGGGRFNELFTLYPLLLALLTMFIAKQADSNSETLDVCRATSALMVFSGCVALLSLLSQTLFRVAYMFLVFAPMQASCLLGSIDSPSTRRAVGAAIALVSAFVFVWAYCYGDASGAYPYLSDILGITQ